MCYTDQRLGMLIHVFGPAQRTCRCGGRMVPERKRTKHLWKHPNCWRKNGDDREAGKDD